MKNNSSNFLIFLLLCFIFPTTCKKLERKMLVSTGDVTNITTTTAEASGEVIDIGDRATQRGHCYAKNPNVNIDSPKTELGAPTGPGGFTSQITDLDAGTKYYIKAYISHGAEIVYGKEISFTTTAPSLPTITTEAVTSITTTSATCGGTVSADGGSPVTGRGVCWNTASDPSIINTITTDGNGTGSFTSSLTNLTPGTTYYVRAYATNSVGTGYGNAISFTTQIYVIIFNPDLTYGSVSDNDGNNYKTIKIGTQTWMAENLKTTKYNDGTSIPLIIDNIAWNLEVTGAYCWYDNDAATYKSTYGALYNWYSVNTSKLCPSGWHMPSDDEMITLTDYLGGESVAGGKLKETGTVHWISPNAGATNETGFTALPGGYRDYDGIFYNIGLTGFWWNSTEYYYTTTDAWSWYIPNHNTSFSNVFNSKKYGSSVRCIEGTIAGTIASKPTINTSSISDIASTSATVGGNVTSDGGDEVTDRGVYYSTSANAETTGTKLQIGSGTGLFSTSLSGLNPITTYYLKAYAINSVGINYGNEISFTTNAIVVSTLSTTAITAITQTTATSGGNITNDGGASVTERGVCWSTVTGPTISDKKTTDGTGSGTFVSSITGLTANTKYYVRGYATNSIGTAYGDEQSFTSSTYENCGTITDADLNNYNTIVIGSQCWMLENLTTTKYSDGTSIPNVTDNSTWAGISTGAFCYYDNNSVAYSDYGKLYNWYAVDDSRKLCPIGWHVPTDAEWRILIDYLGGEGNSGNKIKETGLTHWNCSENHATNESGFTAFGGGRRNSDGTFYGAGIFFYYWSAVETLYGAWISYCECEGGISSVRIANQGKSTGLSVRCVKGDLILIPTLTTALISSITTTSASCGGNVTNDRGASVTERGVCWNTYPNPTIANSKTSDGTGTGVFSSNLTGLTANTTYFIRAYATNSAGTAYGNEVSFITLCVAPTATTETATNVVITAARLNGTVNANNLSTIVTFEYGTTTSYSGTLTAAQSPIAGNSNTAVSADLNSLPPSSTYHYRVKAENCGGPIYGSDQTFTTAPNIVTDNDGNSYNVIEIGTQVWMKENLKAIHYADGTALVNGMGVGDISGDYTTKYWFIYVDNPSNKDTYGLLYTWAAAMNGASSSDANPSKVQGVCPTGWHLPSDAEWKQLEMHLGMSQAEADRKGWRGTDEGGKLKETGTTLWVSPNTGATNESGFSGLPGGYRYSAGPFFNIGYFGYWWSSLEDAFYRDLNYNLTSIYRYDTSKDWGFSVRCLRD